MPEPKITRRKITDYHPAEVNPNKGTVRGVPAIVDSVQYNGFGRPMVSDRDEEMIGGSHTLQALMDAGFDEVIEIETDGTVPIVHKRSDLDLTTDAKARALQIADNRTTILGYEQDDELVASLLNQIAAEDARLVQAAGFDDADVRHLLNQLSPMDDPYAEWVGMPEFEQESINAYHTIKVHFKTLDDLQAFSCFVGQDVTEKTSFIYYPKQERVNVTQYRVIDES